MGYRALYRAYRPSRFEEVAGQSYIVRTLRNQVMQGRVSHAYLFCGSRGTGKTTMAKILAKAANCAAPREGEPCEQCPSCLAQAQERSVDILEMDAASHNGVGDVRDLRDKVQFTPSTGKYRVYIIDEVHRFSAAAFDAFLKTLEEPPPHVIFILATTEPHRIPDTILSRCQRYDFHRIRVADIVARLRKVIGDAPVEENALLRIARAAEGSMRDALSLLDRGLAEGAGQLTEAMVSEILGSASEDFLAELSKKLLEGQGGEALLLLSRAMDQGREPDALARDLARHFRALLITSVCGPSPDLLDVSEDRAQAYMRQVKQSDPALLRRGLERLAQLDGELRYASQPRLTLELALVDISRIRYEPDVESLMLRIQGLEDKLERGAFAAAPPKGGKGAGGEESSASPPPGAPPPDAPPPERGAGHAPAAGASDGQGTAGSKQPALPKGLTAEQAWKATLEKVRGENNRLYFGLRTGTCGSLKGDILTIIFPPGQAIHRDRLEQNRPLVEDAALAATGVRIRVRGVMQGEGGEGPDLAARARDLFGEDMVIIEE